MDISKPASSARAGKVTRRTLLLTGAAAPALAASGAQASQAIETEPGHRKVVLKDTAHVRAYYHRARG